LHWFAKVFFQFQLFQLILSKFRARFQVWVHFYSISCLCSTYWGSQRYKFS